MKILLLYCMMLIATDQVIAQHTIKGRVVQEKTGEGISGCSIFIANTSRGTTTNEAGYFQITDVPSGTHELVVSNVGYQTNVFTFNESQLPLQLKIELAVKIQELSNVTIEPSVEEGWDKWGSTFMQNFIGTTDNADQCRIKNEKKIKFRYYKKSNRLIAYCDEPVLMENKALGYIIHFQLEGFEIKFDERSSSFFGYPLFEPMRTERKNLLDKWKKNRQEAYDGSVMQFVRALYNNLLAEEGYEVKRMVRMPNLEKQRVRNLYRSGIKYKTDSVSHKSMAMYTAKNLWVPADSLNYYQIVLKQDDFVEKYNRELLTADSLVSTAQDGFKTLQFENYLYIVYKNEKEEKKYAAAQFPPRAPTFQRSYVTLINHSAVLIDINGNYYSPEDFLTSAYWGWSEKMANSLPLEYQRNE